MTEYPRKVEGGHTLEVVPGIFVTHFLSGRAAENREAFAGGERVNFDQFQRTAEDIGIPVVNGTRAFNSVYHHLFSQATKLELIPFMYAHEAHLKPDWDFMGSWGNIDKSKRSRILLATQAVHDDYQSYMETKDDKVSLLSQYKVVEAMLGIDELREFEASLKAPYIPPEDEGSDILSDRS